MSTQQQEVAVPHPFNPDKTIRGEQVATARRRDSPFPWAIVRVGDADARVRVPAESLSSD